MKLHNKLFDPNQTNYPTSKIADTFPFELSDGLHHTKKCGARYHKMI